MIKHFEESDLIALFLDSPIYIGPPEAGELIFNRKYDNGLSVTLFLNLYGGRMDISISYADYCVVSYAAQVDKMAILSSAVLFYHDGSMIAQLQMEPYPHLNLLQESMPDYER